MFACCVTFAKQRNKGIIIEDSTCHMRGYGHNVRGDRSKQQ